jgi:hypothetical protein
MRIWSGNPQHLESHYGKVDYESEMWQVRTELMRVLTRFPEACDAVMEELVKLETDEPWTPFPETRL